MPDAFCHDSFSPTWNRDNVSPKSIHGSANPGAKDALEDTLTEMVGDSLDALYADMRDDEISMQQYAEEIGPTELLRLNIKNKYRYKFKYRSARDPRYFDGETPGGHQKNSPLQSLQFDSNSFNAGYMSSQKEKEKAPKAKHNFCIAAEDVTEESVRRARDKMKRELDTTWKKMAGASTREESCQLQEKYMPVARRLKKLVAGLEDLLQLMADLYKRSFDEASRRDTRLGASLSDKKAAGETESKAKLMKALNELGTDEVTSQNLLHTTRHYNLVQDLRKYFGATSSSVSNSDNKLGFAGEGEWNKSILVCKEQVGGGKFGAATGKTFKEFRADPWERKKAKELAQDGQK